MEDIINLKNLEENLFYQGKFDYSEFNDDFIPFTQYSPIELNQINLYKPNPLYQSNNFNNYSYNSNLINYTPSNNTPFSNHLSLDNYDTFYTLRYFAPKTQINNNSIPKNSLLPTNFNASHFSSISKAMIQFKEKLYPLLKQFFIDFANKLINDEPIQLAVIDLEKTSYLDYDLGYYSLPLGTDKFKYKIYNLFDNLKTIARILKISVIIHHKLALQMPCTKRELYYENVDLFLSTDIIDSTESDLCSILGICKFNLPIFPSAKGLFCGNITLVNKFGSRLNINNSNLNNKINLINYEYLIEDFDLDENSKNYINLIQNNEMFVGNNNNGCSSRNNIDDSCHKYFVLIIEKETLFFNLVGNYQFFKKFPNAIIITGKGYPDYITKVFITKLFNLVNNIPFIYFGDHDPHGFEIYLNYLFGSIQSSKENNFMCLGNINWIGLSHENIEAILKFGLIDNEFKKEIYEENNNLLIDNNDYLNKESVNKQVESGLIKLDNKDKIKIQNILKREYFNFDEKWINSNNPFSEKILSNLKIIKNELLLMESSDYKAEGEYLVSKYFNDFLFLVEEAIN